jgi:hypothetical protein
MSDLLQLDIYQRSFQEGKMKVIERIVQKIGDWQSLEELDQKHNVIESKYGFPPKRRYRAFAGPHSIDTLIIEREWESMAVMEEAFTGLLADTEYPAISESYPGVVLSSQWELYMVM